MKSGAQEVSGRRYLRHYLVLLLLGLWSYIAPAVASAHDCTVQAFSVGHCDGFQLNYRIYGLGEIPHGDGDPRPVIYFQLLVLYFQLQLETAQELSLYSGPTIAALIGPSWIEISALNFSRSAGGSTADQPVLISGLQISTQAVAPANLSGDLGWVSEWGTIAEIGVKIEFIKSILKLLSDKQSLPLGKSDALNLIVNGGELLPYLRFQGQSTFGVDAQLRPFLSNVTIRLNTEFLNSIIGSETRLDPKDWQVLVEKVQIKVGLGGSTSFSGETIFERGQGLTSQIFTIESAVGNIRLTGQATFTPTSQEFRIGASICDLAFTGTSLITATGQIQQSFGFQLKFGGLTTPRAPATTPGSCGSP
ncbi:hypothetical protein HYR54_12115 [Candidatus Acetothermia bacterium]|nr:hypothetical protein [Candidatus Acetothermia bacterium]MBI3460464.1 hypothetical protein [Candidatus Acetothermia bacterium]